MKKLLLLLLLMVAFCCNSIKAAQKIDEITITGLGVTSSSYNNGTFSGKEFVSGAVYAGKCIRDGSNIQLNGTKSNFVTTKSGGKIVKVEVAFGKSSKDVVLYSKNEPYGVDESHKNGTELATLKYEQTNPSAVFTPTEGQEIKYIGIGSTGAVYLSEIKITWEEESDTPGGGTTEPTTDPALPVVTFDQDGKTVTAVEGGSYAVDLSTTINVTSENATSITVIGGENTQLELAGPTASFNLEEFGEYMFEGSKDEKPGEILTITFTEKQTDPVQPTTGNTYKLVTSVDDLVAGENYVLASTVDGTTYAMSTAVMSSGGMHPTKVTLTDGVLTTGSEVLVFKLGGESDAWLWNFTNYEGTGKGLAYNSSTDLSPTGPTETTVSITQEDAKIQFNKDKSRWIMCRLNNSVPVFKNYSSANATATGYHQIRIYKQVKKVKKEYTLPSQTGSIFVGDTYQILLGDEHPANISYSVPEGSPYATVSADGRVTGLEAGSVAVTVSWAGDDLWEAGSGLVNITVKAPLADPALSFLHDVVRGKLGVGVAALAADHVGTGAVTYTSGNPDVVVVNEKTGMVDLACVLAAGEAVITASIAATDTHKAATASYRIVIEAPSDNGLTFATKVYNTYAGEPTVVNAASNADNSIPAGNIIYTIDDLGAADYSVNRDDEAAGNLTVTVANPGVYTLRAESAATGGLLEGFAILRLNVFPRIDVVVSENCVAQEKNVVVLPENGGKINFSDMPSTVSVLVSRSDEGDAFSRYDGTDLVLGADTEIAYKLEYASTSAFATGQSDLHVYLIPKKPECVKTDNKHIISVEQDNVKILYRSMIYNIPGAARAHSLAERAAAEGAWTEVNAMSHSIEIPELQPDQLFIVDTKTVKTTAYAGDLESEVVTTGYDNSGNLSGINEMSVDAAEVEFFNLQGVRVDGELAPGVYIRRQGSTVSKVVIR